jgi:hypothetical protein
MLKYINDARSHERKKIMKRKLHVRPGFGCNSAAVASFENSNVTVTAHREFLDWVSRS